MAKTSVDQWDATASNNTDVGGVNIAEGCAPGNINDALRNIMAQIKAYDADIPRVDETETVSGSWTYTGSVNLSGATLTLANGQIITAHIADENVTTAKLADAGLRSFASNTSTAAAKIPRATGLNTWGELDFLDQDDMASDSATAVPSQQSVKAYVDSKPFNEEFISSAQTITSGGDLTLPHGLSSTPKLFTLLLKCVVSEGNWTVGDELLIAPGANGNQGCAIRPDGTNIFVQFGSNGSVFSVNNETGGANVTLTNTSWTLIVKAWA